MIIPRRGFLGLAVGLVCAPAIVRVGSLMPVRSFEDLAIWTVDGVGPMWGESVTLSPVRTCIFGTSKDVARFVKSTGKPLELFNIHRYQVPDIVVENG